MDKNRKFKGSKYYTDTMIFSKLKKGELRVKI